MIAMFSTKRLQIPIHNNFFNIKRVYLDTIRMRLWMEVKLNPLFQKPNLTREIRFNMDRTQCKVSFPSAGSHHHKVPQKVAIVVRESVKQGNMLT